MSRVQDIEQTLDVCKLIGKRKLSLFKLILWKMDNMDFDIKHCICIVETFNLCFVTCDQQILMHFAENWEKVKITWSFYCCKVTCFSNHITAYNECCSSSLWKKHLKATKTNTWKPWVTSENWQNCPTDTNVRKITIVPVFPLTMCCHNADGVGRYWIRS